MMEIIYNKACELIAQADELLAEGVCTFDELQYIDEAFLGQYTTLTTSGTTGKPMVMVRDSYNNIIHGALMQKRLLRGLDPDLFNTALHRTAHSSAKSRRFKTQREARYEPC